jgi:predicted O-methyltransferase YrrM
MLLQRIKSRISREIRKRLRKDVPLQEQTTLQLSNNNFFEPVIVGPSTFIEDCISVKTIEKVMEVYKKLQADDFISAVVKIYEAGIKRFGRNWKYADIATVLYGICSHITIKKYLEIGVRKGRSMSIVASLHPTADIIGFDKWMPNYCGIDNPGPDFVKDQLKKVGHIGSVALVSGDSRKTVPQFIQKNNSSYFDLATVDGGHSYAVATADLKNVIPQIKVGGILVFDDISNQYMPDCSRVWKNVIESSSRFKTYSFSEIGYGAAFAIKQY